MTTAQHAGGPTAMCIAREKNQLVSVSETASHYHKSSCTYLPLSGGTKATAGDQLDRLTYTLREVDGGGGQRGGTCGTCFTFKRSLLVLVRSQLADSAFITGNVEIGARPARHCMWQKKGIKITFIVSSNKVVSEWYIYLWIGIVCNWSDKYLIIDNFVLNWSNVSRPWDHRVWQNGSMLHVTVLILIFTITRNVLNTW